MDALCLVKDGKIVFQFGPGGNFERKANKLVEGLPNGTMAHLWIRHDEWCRLLRRDGECDCDPDVTVSVDDREN